jgi:hypothetical protein
MTYLEWLKMARSLWLAAYGTDILIPGNPPISGQDTKMIDKIVKKLDKEILTIEEKENT